MRVKLNIIGLALNPFLIPKAPTVKGAAEDDVALIRGEVDVGVVHVLQAGAPVVHLIISRRGTALRQPLLSLYRGISYCKLTYFRAAKFSRIKPYEKYSRS